MIVKKSLQTGDKCSKIAFDVGRIVQKLGVTAMHAGLSFCKEWPHTAGSDLIYMEARCGFDKSRFRLGRLHSQQASL